MQVPARAPEPRPDPRTGFAPDLSDFDPHRLSPRAGETSFTRLWRERTRSDRTTWAQERAALERGRAITRWWDAMRASEHPLAILARLPFARITIPPLAEKDDLEDSFQRLRHAAGPRAGEDRVLSPAAWKDAIAGLSAEGWTLAHIDFRHVAAEPSPPRSIYEVDLQVARRTPPAAAAVRARLSIAWGASGSGGALADVLEATVVSREGPPLLAPELLLDPTAGGGAPRYVEPLVVRDLDGDGLDEILALGTNEVLENQGGGRFLRRPLLPDPEPKTLAALVADLTGDTVPDLLCGTTRRNRGRLLLYPGDPSGCFRSPGRRVEAVEPHFLQPSAITTGDVEGDLDLDVFVSQYKAPYLGGQMPTPYWDANDGFPSFLLLNDGAGRFVDATVAAGLGETRFRRTFSASFLDLDGDEDLDLLVVSDFCGLELHVNDGRGHFTAATSRVTPAPFAFGMAHAIDDFDGDGRLDLYVIGMNAPAADRLESMGLPSGEVAAARAMRRAMTAGNRLLLGGPDGTYTASPHTASVARTGWSYGCATFDLENDGDRDVYVANGYISGRTTEDFGSEYWRHHVFLGDSGLDPELDLFFSRTMQDLHSGRMSWDGQDADVLFLNRGGEGFEDVGFAAGAGSPWDGRGVVAGDLDGDGGVDLLVVEQQGTTSRGFRADGQRLHVLLNRAPRGRWIGVRLREHGRGFSPHGARIRIETPAGPRVRALVTGDSYYAQHPPVARFGLGRDGEVRAVEVRWPNGRVTRVENPPLDRVLDVAPGDPP